MAYNESTSIPRQLHNQGELLNSIEAKMSKLLGINTHQATHIATLRQEGSRLSREIADQSNTIRQLRHRLSVATLSTAQQGGDGQQELTTLRNQVEQLIATVDECIQYLQQGR